MQKTERIQQIAQGSGRFARRRFWSSVIVTLASLPSPGWAAPKPESGKALQIYFVDVEGGQSTLFVTPLGESLLIDTGWPDSNGRDADRIMAGTKLAGLKELEVVLLTHYHIDHAGGITQRSEERRVGEELSYRGRRRDGQSSRQEA